MTSWQNNNSPIYKNKTVMREGTFIKKEKPATVVSAYYEMPSKYKLEDYRKWISLFLKNVPMYLIFFTESKTYEFIKECRIGYEERTRIIVLERSEWVANTYEQSVWNSLHTIDPEKVTHNPELYKIWFEKLEFVKRGIQINPYGHDDFLWVDAGICRKENVKNLILKFPVADRIPVDRMMVLQVMPFTRSDNEKRILNGVEIFAGTSKDRIAAGIIAGRKQIWEKYSALYYNTLDKFKKAGIFWGKEQNVLSSMVIENREFFSLIQTRPIIQEFWLYSLVYLGSDSRLYERMIDENRNREAKGNEELLRIADNTRSIRK